MCVRRGGGEPEAALLASSLGLPASRVPGAGAPSCAQQAEESFPSWVPEDGRRVSVAGRGVPVQCSHCREACVFRKVTLSL